PTPFGKVRSRVTTLSCPLVERRNTPLNGSSLAGSLLSPRSPYDGSVKYRSPFGAHARSFGLLKRFPSKRSTTTVRVNSESFQREMPRLPWSATTSVPFLSNVSPLVPSSRPGGLVPNA